MSAGFVVGFVVGLSLGMFLMSRVVRMVNGYADEWFEDSNRWMNRYFELRGSSAATECICIISKGLGVCPVHHTPAKGEAT